MLIILTNEPPLSSVRRKRILASVTFAGALIETLPALSLVSWNVTVQPVLSKVSMLTFAPSGAIML